MSLRSVVLRVLILVEWVFTPVTFLAGIWLFLIRRAGIQRLKANKRVLDAIGVFPIRKHYYEPAFEFSYLTHSLRDERELPGIDMNYEGQLGQLNQFRFGPELREFPVEQNGPGKHFYYKERQLLRRRRRNLLLGHSPPKTEAAGRNRKRFFHAHCPCCNGSK